MPPLPYDFAALEPSIDAKTMELHHDKHHAAYVKNLNAAVKDHPKVAEMKLEEILSKLPELPDDIRTVVRNNAGGHANHSMFWQVMGPAGGSAPAGELKAAIDSDLGGLDMLKEDFNAKGAKVFGSGWVFVTVTPAGKLAIEPKTQPGPPAHGRRTGAVRQRRVGARLLPEIPEPPPGIPQGMVGRRQLEGGRREICRRQGRSLTI